MGLLGRALGAFARAVEKVVDVVDTIIFGRPAPESEPESEPVEDEQEPDEQEPGEQELEEEPWSPPGPVPGPEPGSEPIGTPEPQEGHWERYTETDADGREVIGIGWVGDGRPETPDLMDALGEVADQADSRGHSGDVLVRVQTDQGEWRSLSFAVGLDAAIGQATFGVRRWASRYTATGMAGRIVAIEVVLW